jgi:hypothetical protein
VCRFAFQGKSGELLPGLLGVREEVEALKTELGYDATGGEAGAGGVKKQEAR